MSHRRQQIPDDLIRRSLITWICWCGIVVALLLYGVMYSIRWTLLPHRFCLIEQPQLVWSFAIVDATIALVYFFISSVLATVVWRIPRAFFAPRLVYWFASFILTCGLTHVMLVLTLWFPVYYPQLAMGALCAVCSVGAAVEIRRAKPALERFLHAIAKAYPDLTSWSEATGS